MEGKQKILPVIKWTCDSVWRDFLSTWKSQLVIRFGRTLASEPRLRDKKTQQVSLKFPCNTSPQVVLHSHRQAPPNRLIGKISSIMLSSS